MMFFKKIIKVHGYIDVKKKFENGYPNNSEFYADLESVEKNAKIS